MMLNSRFLQGLVKSFRIALLVLGGALVGVGCEHKGPVEEAGEKIDQTVESAKDRLNPEGSAEKAGKKIDQAVDKATDK